MGAVNRRFETNTGAVSAPIHASPLAPSARAASHIRREQTERGKPNTGDGPLMAGTKQERVRVDPPYDFWNQRTKQTARGATNIGLSLVN
jgi:hypothetical protein